MITRCQEEPGRREGALHSTRPRVQAPPPTRSSQRTPSRGWMPGRRC